MTYSVTPNFVADMASGTQPQRMLSASQALCPHTLVYFYMHTFFKKMFSPVILISSQLYIMFNDISLTNKYFQKNHRKVTTAASPPPAPDTRFLGGGKLDNSLCLLQCPQPEFLEVIVFCYSLILQTMAVMALSVVEIRHQYR